MISNTEHERWQQVEELFHQAAELPPGERIAFLDARCAGDNDLRREAGSLLAAADRTLRLLSEPVRATMEDLADAVTGQFIGPYRIVRVLGEGGMGKVFLASRADQQFEQFVAIKVMHASQFAPRGMLLRFRSERQILANLNHPNIARLLDGGITTDGVPYIVMEYIDGTPLHVYCRERALPVAARLALFREVCSAVDYAHRHLVVHRDLKPANILVTAEGVPQLLDFGIAKLLNPEVSSAEMAPTGTLDRMLTPDYASPEQLRGEPISTASDVYSLGALLYELLSGSRPLRIDNTNPVDAARMICETIPDAPSATARAHPESAPPDAYLVLKGDLDRIVLMALRKEPSRRYSSVMRLAEDVEAYQNGFPVQARTATWNYVAGRFVRRHRWGVAASAVMLTVLITFALAMTILKRRADRQQSIASQQAEFLAGMFQAASPNAVRGKTVTARDLLDIGAKRIEAQTSTDPEVRAALLANIAESYNSLGDYSDSLRLAQEAYDTQSRLYGAESPRSADSLNVLSTTYRLADDYKNAEPLFRRLLRICQQTKDPASIPLEVAYMNLGECLDREEKDTEAESILREALAIDHRNPSMNGVAVRNYLALTIEQRSAFTEAAQLLHEAVAISARYEGADGTNYALSLHNLSGAQIDAGDLYGAEATLREVLALRRRILGNDHPELAYTLNNLAFVLLEKGDAAAALPVATEARNVRIKHVGPNDRLTLTCTGNLGRALEGLGHYSEADAYYDQVLVALRQAGDPNGLRAAQMYNYKALLQFDQRHFSAAETLWRQALAIRERLSPASPAVAATLADIAEARIFQHDIDGAEPLLRRSLDIRKNSYPPTHPVLVAGMARLGEVLWLRKSYDEARAILEDAENRTHTATYPLYPWQIAEVQSMLGACLKSQGHVADGERLLAASRDSLATDPRPILRIPADKRYTP